MVIRDVLGNTIRLGSYFDDMNLRVPVEVDDLVVKIIKGSDTFRTFTLASNPDDLWKDGVENKYFLRIATGVTATTPEFTTGTYNIYYDFVYGSDLYRKKCTLILSS